MTEEILIRFINNTCTDEELAAVKAWLDESDDNASLLFGIERIAAGAAEKRTGLEAEKSRTFADIKIRLIQQKLEQKRRLRHRILKWTAAAAAAVVIALSSLALYRIADARMVTVETFAEGKSVTLPDGTMVHLNKYSRLSYSEKFVCRKVVFSGEGFFKVVHNEEAPFVVVGDYITVSDLGTEFNFNSHTDGANNVCLIEGSVKVSRDNDSRSGIVLEPGQKASYDIVTGNLMVSNTNTGIETAWHDRIIPFTNASIASIAADLEQLYGVKITLRGIDTSKTYSGATVYYENIDSTLRQLANTLPIRFTRAGSGEIVISQK